MSKLTTKSVLLIAAIFLPALLSFDVANSQGTADLDPLPVDVMQVLEFPAHLSNPILLRSEKGYRFKCQISNNSDDRILGFTYQLLVLDSANKIRMMASQTAALTLTGYATKDLTLRLPQKLQIKSGRPRGVRDGPSDHAIRDLDSTELERSARSLWER